MGRRWAVSDSPAVRVPSVGDLDPQNNTESAYRSRALGDLDASGPRVESHQTAAYRVADANRANACRAEDAVQEAFVHASRALARFRAARRFGRVAPVYVHHDVGKYAPSTAVAVIRAVRWPDPPPTSCARQPIRA